MSKRDLRRRKQKLRQRQPASPTSSVREVGPIERDFAEAIRHYQSGRLEAAHDGFCRVLKQQPQHLDAWHLLGMVMFQAGDGPAALECLNHALAATTSPPAELLSNLGLVHRSLGDLESARDALQRAVSDQPTLSNAWNNLGTVLLESREYAQAETCFRKTLELCATHVNAHTNLGTSLQHQRRYLEAQACHERALELNPQDAKALNNIGICLRSQRRYDAALEAFQRAHELMPNAEEVQINLGRTLVSLARLDEAIECFQQLIVRRPDSAACHHHLGHALELAQRHDEAMAAFEKSISLDPDYAHGHSALGSARLRRGQSDEAIQLFRQALQLRPDLHETHSNLLFILSGDDRVTPRELYDEHVRWGERHGTVSEVFVDYPQTRDPDRRLRIGYVSPDLREHAVARFFEPVLNHHDSSQVETFCYAQVQDPDHVTERLRSRADHWRPTCGHSYRQVAEMIHRDRIDLLVDLAGHTAGNRLVSFAYRPAPVQLTWLGYPNTTGLPAMDYRLTSEVQDPPGEEAFHTERLVRLPGGTNCYAPPTESPPIGPLPVDRVGWITFGSLHRPDKISPAVYDLWADVMHANPNARLLLFNTRFDRASTEQATRQLSARGLTPDRFEVRRKTNASHYLELYREIDIALDVFPWNGGTTTREALWMGAAVIGLLGTRRRRGAPPPRCITRDFRI